MQVKKEKKNCKLKNLLQITIILSIIILNNVNEVNTKRVIEYKIYKPESKVNQINKIVQSEYFDIKPDIKVPLLGDLSQISEYYINISLGTPPQTFFVQFDTGSADLAIPIANCPNCSPHPHPSYEPSLSSTSISLGCTNTQVACRSCLNGQCGYSIQYLDNSGFSAYLYNDTCLVDDFQYRQVFGAIYNEKNGAVPFQPLQVDGIIGFAYRDCSQVNAPTMIDVLVDTGVIDDIFSVCSNTVGGVITLGGIGEYYSGQIEYTPIIEEFYYRIYVTDILVAGKSIGVSPYIYNSGGAVIDSGTTDIIIPEEAYSALSIALSSLCEKTNLVGVCDVSSPKFGLFSGYCFSMTPKDIEAFPTIDFVMSGGIICSVRPENYLVKGYCSNTSLYALAIDPGKTYYGLILGDAFMKNFEIVFDRQNQRIGFASVSTCAL